MARIRELLSEELIITSLEARDKAGVLKEFAELLYNGGRVRDAAELEDVLARREALGSTGIGDGIAIPHGKLSGIGDIILAFGISREGIDFSALDGKPSHIFFLLVAPEDAPSEHLKALARISRLLKSAAFREALMSSRDARDILSLISDEEEGIK